MPGSLDIERKHQGFHEDSRRRFHTRSLLLVGRIGLSIASVDQPARIQPDPSLARDCLLWTANQGSEVEEGRHQFRHRKPVINASIRPRGRPLSRRPETYWAARNSATWRCAGSSFPGATPTNRRVPRIRRAGSLAAPQTSVKDGWSSSGAARSGRVYPAVPERTCAAHSLPAASISASASVADESLARCSPFGSSTSIRQACSNVSLRDSGHAPCETDLASMSRFCGFVSSLCTALAPAPPPQSHRYPPRRDCSRGCP